MKSHSSAAAIFVLLGCLAGCLAVARADTPALHGTARSGGHPVAHAVVWLDAPDAPPGPRKHVVLDQRNLTFSPHVLVVRTGTIVDFPNNDRVFHNVFSFRDGKIFDLGLYPVGASKPIVFDHPGLSRIFCNIHPNMSAYVLVVDTPYYAVSDERGSFSIDSLPARSFPYHAWRAGADMLTGLWNGDTPLAIEWR